MSSDANLFRQPYEIANGNDARQPTPAYPPFLHSAMVAVAAAAAAGYPQQLASNPISSHPLNLTANPTDYQYRYNPFHANDVCRIPSYYPYYQYQQPHQNRRENASLYALPDQAGSSQHQSVTAKTVNPSTNSSFRSSAINGNDALRGSPFFGCSTAGLPTHINSPATSMCLQTSGSNRVMDTSQMPGVNSRQPHQRNQSSRTLNVTPANKLPTGKSGSRGRKAQNSDEAFMRKRQEFDELVKARTDKLLSDGLTYGTLGELPASTHSSNVTTNGNLSSISASASGTLDAGCAGGGSSPNYKKLIQAVMDAKKSTLLRSPNVVSIIERQQRTLNAFKQKTELFFVNSGE